jgi:hypothetical protein
MEYQKLKIKKFARKEFKHSIDGRYWKKFDTVHAMMEPGFMINSLSFCVPHNIEASQSGPNSGLLATTKGARVELWKLQ